ncbi:DUF616 domain-containing protein [bacterium]|nr:DUF616 domain-containing protein [bacterium]
MAPTVLVYTSIFGGYDELQPAPVHDGRYVCITDEPQDVPVWRFRLERAYPSPRLASRKTKILSQEHFPDEDMTIWLGGWIRMTGDPEALAKKYLRNHDIAAFAHPHRSSVFNEARMCIRMGKGNPKLIQKQMEYYRRTKFPDDRGLSACFVLFRRVTQQMERFEQRWWRQIQNFSVRDQLSFEFVLWRMGIEINRIPWDEFSKNFIWLRRHRG